MPKAKRLVWFPYTCIRPFSAKHFLAAVPKTAKSIAVLDRTKEPGANGEPLYLDVKGLLLWKENAPVVVGGRYGLSSKDTTPAQICSLCTKILAMPICLRINSLSVS
jgi:pyruvate-ferredoxin/flavodoxin oxidoreductase